MLCSIYQRYKLKAIHNCCAKYVPVNLVVLNISKIQTESNSQLFMLAVVNQHCCAQYIKDTN